jgi:2-dehydropantoate 2-reductase
MKSVDDAIKVRLISLSCLSLPRSMFFHCHQITIKNYQRSSGPTTPATPGTQGDASGKQGHGSPDSEASSFQSPDDFKPSMLLDVEAGRPSELEPIIGSVLDRARAKGVATPRLDLVYASYILEETLTRLA